MGRLLYYLPSGHRTESHIPHLSLPVSLLCCLFLSHKSLLFSAIPSRLFSPFFHPSGVHVCSYSHLSCHCCSVSFTPFPLQSICSSLVSPLFLLFSPLSSLVVSSFSISLSSSSVDSCLSRGNLFIHPSRALSSAVPT